MRPFGVMVDAYELQRPSVNFSDVRIQTLFDLFDSHCRDEYSILPYWQWYISIPFPKNCLEDNISDPSFPKKFSRVRDSFLLSISEILGKCNYAWVIKINRRDGVEKYYDNPRVTMLIDGLPLNSSGKPFSPNRTRMLLAQAMKSSVAKEFGDYDLWAKMRRTHKMGYEILPSKYVLFNNHNLVTRMEEDLSNDHEIALRLYNTEIPFGLGGARGNLDELKVRNSKNKNT